MRSVKKIAIAAASVIMAACFTFGFAACGDEGSGSSSGWGNEFSISSAYAEAQELGYTGTLEEFIASISGKDGEDGTDGVGIEDVYIENGHLYVQLDNDSAPIDCGVLPTGECEHSYTITLEDLCKAPTATEDGYDVVACDKCGDMKMVTVPATGDEPQELHLYNYSIATYATADYHIVECEICGGTKTVPHTIGEDGTCSVCNDGSEDIYDEATGLTLRLNAEKTGYTIVNASSALIPTDFTIPSGYNGLPITAIGDNAFYGTNFYIINLTIPASIERIGQDAFRSNSALETVTFENRGNLKEIDEWAFNYCRNLTSITNIPATLTELTGAPFINNDALTTVTFEEGSPFEVDGQSIVDRATNTLIYNISGGEIPDDITRLGDYSLYKRVTDSQFTIPEDITYIGEYALYGANMQSINIPAGVEYVGTSAIGGCDELTTITVDENNPYYTAEGNCLIEKSTNTLIAGCSTSIIPYYVTKIGDYAFYRCNNLLQITLPDGLAEIGDDAFYQCNNLGQLTIPASVEYIGNNAFHVLGEDFQRGYIPLTFENTEGWYFAYIDDISIRDAIPQSLVPYIFTNEDYDPYATNNCLIRVAE